MKSETYDEILSQPASWKAVIDNAERQFPDFLAETAGAGGGRLAFVGCGASYYLSLTASAVCSEIGDWGARALAASDVVFFPYSCFARTEDGYSVFLISRSGATTETLQAAKAVKDQLHYKALALTCRPGSELARICDAALAVPEADEKSVVMTRSFTSMLLLVQLVVAQRIGEDAFESELRQLPEFGKEVIGAYRDTIRQIAEHKSFSKFVYLGQGPFYGLACESMLNAKEMALCQSEAYPSLEFRHGPMATVDEKMLITFLLSDRGRRAEVELLAEMKGLGARTLAICDRADTELARRSDYVLELRSGLTDFARLLLYMPLTQLLGYYLAVSKGLDPDKPRNLTQVVTLS